MNIFKMSLEDAEKAIDGVLENMTKEEIRTELIECGFEVEENITYNIHSKMYKYKDIGKISMFDIIFGQVNKKSKLEELAEAV